MARRLLIAALPILLLAACSSHRPAGPLTDRQYYEQAQKAMTNGNYQTAVQKLEELESHYPVGNYTEQAQLELIFANFKHLDYAAAVAAADRFIRLHPSHPQLDYAYYLRGLANQEMNRGSFDRYLPMEGAHRDLASARSSYNDYRELVTRFPDSPYVPDARARMIYLRNQLAQQELHVAHYYVRRNACVAAINRGRYILENFPTSPAQEPATAIIGLCYERMGQTQLADEYRALLRQNFPNTKLLDKQQHFAVDLGPRNERRSWLNIMTFGLLGTKDRGVD